MINIKELLNLELPLILASQSPRRQKLMANLGFKFQILPSPIEEDFFDLTLLPIEFAKKLALLKAKYVAERTDHPAIILGADTIVVLNKEILNKPKNEDDAYIMLRKLSGNTHIVYTGIALVSSKDGRILSDVQKTEVTFRDLSDEEIYAYIKTGSPMDKAGAYGIQDDFGAVFVSHIVGCYYNIVGLPLEMLYTSLIKFKNI